MCSRLVLFKEKVQDLLKPIPKKSLVIWTAKLQSYHTLVAEKQNSVRTPQWEQDYT